MTPPQRLNQGVGLLALALTLTIWALFVYLQRVLPLPPLRMSPGWHWALTALFALDAVGTVIWSLGILAGALREGRLARTGPYALVRHPMYSAVMYSGTAAVAFAFQAWVVLLAVVPVHLVWLRLARMEEAELRGRFGKGYSEYAAATGQFLPRLRSLTLPPSNSQERPD
ncbi:MAG: methyltransferase [Candidatus Neomarinimicrobiota bacterium]